MSIDIAQAGSRTAAAAGTTTKPDANPRAKGTRFGRARRQAVVPAIAGAVTALVLPQTARITKPDKAHPARRRIRTNLLGAGVALTGLLGSVTAGVVTAPAAHASTMTVQVINTGSEGISSRYAPQLAARNGYGAPANASVVTQCYGFGDAVGPYANRLWWTITYAGRTFWAPDRYLSTPNAANQPYAGARSCSTPTSQPAPPPPPSTTSTAATRAAAYARTLVGQTFANASDAAIYPAWSWGQPYGEWAGDCPKLPGVAYARATGNNSYIPRVGDADDLANYYRSRGRVQGGVPPVGALVFYDIARPYGHVAISIGGGQIVTTRGLDGNRYANSQVAYTFFGNYLGWAMP